MHDFCPVCKSAAWWQQVDYDEIVHEPVYACFKCKTMRVPDHVTDTEPPHDE